MTSTTAFPAKTCIALDSYRHPPEPATEVVRTGLHGLWQRVWRIENKPTTMAMAQRDLRAAPHFLLERVAPEPNWTEFYLRQVQEVLDTWLAAEPATAGVQFLISAPHSLLYQSVKAWAKQHEWSILRPPTPAEILADDEQWLAPWKESNFQERWLLPPLEKCYLRHHDGLNLLRRLVELLRLQQPACLLVCNSWAWAYLDQALHIATSLPAPLTLPPFDAADLNQWLADLARGEQKRTWSFRKADSGESIFWTEGSDSDQTAADEQGGAPENGQRTAWLRAIAKEWWLALQQWIYRFWHGRTNSNVQSQFLRHLAARSRGNQRIAWLIWRHSLQVVHEEVKEEAQAMAAEDRGQTIWVRPWEQVALPTVFPNAGVNEALVLHALLVHNGLTDELLPQVLPLPVSEILSCLHQLNAARVVARQEGVWRTTELGYPSVRAFLIGENFGADRL